MTSLLRAWWAAPDHYDWLNAYLRMRNATTTIGRYVAVALFLFGSADFLMLFTPAGPRDGIQRIAGAAVVGMCFFAGIGWLRRWPTRRQSMAFCVICICGLAVACFVERDPYSGLLATSLFSVLGGYIGIFHSARLIVFNVLVAIAVSTTLTVQVFAHDPTLAVAKLLALLGVITVIPSICHTLLRMLGPDALQADTDTLTGLLNRRGFYARASDLFNRSRSKRHDQCLVVAMVDLDKFKRINDTLGHIAGDSVLVSVSQSLLRTSGPGSVIARIGGEEFVLAELINCGDVSNVARRLTQAVAAHRVTASVGLVWLPAPRTCSILEQAQLSELLRLADGAMYNAKRSGGNRFCVRAAPSESWPATT